MPVSTRSNSRRITSLLTSPRFSSTDHSRASPSALFDEHHLVPQWCRQESGDALIAGVGEDLSIRGAWVEARRNSQVWAQRLAFTPPVALPRRIARRKTERPPQEIPCPRPVVCDTRNGSANSPHIRGSELRGRREVPSLCHSRSRTFVVHALCICPRNER